MGQQLGNVLGKPGEDKSYVSRPVCMIPFSVNSQALDNNVLLSLAQGGSFLCKNLCPALKWKGEGRELSCACCFSSVLNSK